MRHIALIVLVSAVFSAFLLPSISADAGDVWKACTESNDQPGETDHTATVSGTTYVCCSAGGNFAWYEGTSCPSKIITVNSPKANDVWQIGTTKPVQWSSVGTITNVMIEISRNDGAYETLFASTPNDGTQDWKVTGPASNARIRISDADDPSTSPGTSDQFRIVTEPEISLSASPASAVADGTTPSTITATTTDTRAGTVISFVSSRGNADKITPATCTTDSAGKCFVSATSAAVGTPTITGSATGYKSGNADLTFVEAPPNTGTLSGKVTDITTGTGLSGAAVTVGARSTTTDNNGNYALGGIDPGTYTATAGKQNYQSSSTTVSISQSATTTQNFALQPTKLVLFQWTQPKKMTTDNLEDVTPVVTCSSRYHCIALWLEGTNLMVSSWYGESWSAKNKLDTGMKSGSYPKASCPSLSGLCLAVAAKSDGTYQVYRLDSYTKESFVNPLRGDQADVSCSSELCMVVVHYGDKINYRYMKKTIYPGGSYTLGWWPQDGPTRFEIEPVDGDTRAGSGSYNPKVGCVTVANGPDWCLLTYTRGSSMYYKTGPDDLSSPGVLKEWYDENTAYSGGGFITGHTLSCPDACLVTATQSPNGKHMFAGSSTVSSSGIPTKMGTFNTYSMGSIASSQTPFTSLSCTSLSNCVWLASWGGISHSRFDGNIGNSYTIEGKIQSTSNSDTNPSISCPTSQFCMAVWQTQTGTGSSTNEISYSFGYPSPPAAPSTPVRPSGTTTIQEGVQYTYTTSSTDANSDFIKYTFDWGDGETTETRFMQPDVSAGASHKWSFPGIYQIRVRATDAAGEISQWSSPLSVTLEPPCEYSLSMVGLQKTNVYTCDSKNCVKEWNIVIKDSSVSSCAQSIGYEIPAMTKSSGCHPDTGIYTYSSSISPSNKKSYPFDLAAVQRGGTLNAMKVFLRTQGPSSCTLTFDFQIDNTVVDPSFSAIPPGTPNQPPHVSIFTVSGDASSFKAEWKTLYPDLNSNRDMKVKCSLWEPTPLPNGNCDPEKADCSSVAEKRCMPYDESLGSDEVKAGSCTVSTPTYDHQSTNKMICIFYDPADTSLKKRIDYEFNPITFDARSAGSITTTVGQTVELKIDVTNTGVLSDSYEITITPPIAIDAIPTSVTTSTIEPGQITSAFTSLTPLIDQESEVTVEVKSVTSGKTSTFVVTVNPGLYALPEFGLTGFIQIIVIAGAIYFLFFRDSGMKKRERRR